MKKPIKQPKTTVRAIRLEPEVWDYYKGIAERNDRTITAEIGLQLKRGIKK